MLHNTDKSQKVSIKRNDLKAVTSERKIYVLISTFYSSYENILEISKTKEITLDKVPGLIRSFNKVYPDFDHKNDQEWLITIFNSLIISVNSKQSSKEWFAQQLNPYKIKLLDVGFDNGIGKCFNQAFGLLNSCPSSLFIKIKSEQGNTLVDREKFQLIVKDYISKNCETEIKPEDCRIGDLVFYEKNGFWNHVSLVITILGDKIYVLSKPGLNPSMIHRHNIAKTIGGDTQNLHFYRTNSSVKESKSLIKTTTLALDLLGYVDISCLEKSAKKYFSRLKCVLGSGKPFISQNPEKTKAFLPKFWLDQLSSDAINELSQGLNCPKEKLRF